MKRKRTDTQEALARHKKINELLDEGVAVVRELDPIMREKYRDDPVMLAKWEEASRIVPARPRKSARAAPPPDKPKN